MLHPTNSDPDNSKRRVESITLERDRLNAAMPILQQRYAKAEHRERIEALKPKYNALVAQHNKCAETLFTLYHDFCEQVVPLLDSTVKLNSEIRRMNADVHAKGFTEFPTIPTIAEHLIEKLVLPSGNGVNYWPDPKTANAVAVQWSDAVAQAYSSPLRQAASSPDWAAARAIQDEAKKAEWARINALQERQQAEAKREFEQSKKVAR